jgi:N-formylmaleamate deformylase
MAGWAARSCKANGIEVHYLRTGGDKLPIVLLHGLSGSGACWTPCARALADEYDVVMPDARGHGASSAPEGGYRYDDLAADALGLIDALGLSLPVLLGHSMGGMTAAVVASKNPGRLRGLVLADPTFLTPERQREVHESDVAAQHRRMLGRPSDEVLAELGARHSHRSAEIVGLIADARRRTDIRAFDILTPPTPDPRELIRALEVPGLLVIGDAGAVVTRDDAEELAKLNPRLTIEQIAGAGHGLPYDQPERFAAAVRAFLHRLSA